MSRFGKLPIKIPAGVTVTINNGEVTVVGPKGTLVRSFPKNVDFKVEEGSILVLTGKESKESRAMQGTAKAHVTNMIKGVSEGFSKQLEIVGAGYRAEVRGNDLVMQIGYSHPVVISAFDGISFKVEKNFVTVSGADKENVGQISALVRGSRPPEPYKGTGIKYTDEVIRRKAGKQAAK